MFVPLDSLSTKYGISAFYPVYHSLHDTVYWIEKFIDPEYKVHRSVAQVALYAMLYMADIPLLPFDNRRYGERLVRDTQELMNKLKEKDAHKHGVSVGED